MALLQDDLIGTPWEGQEGNFDHNPGGNGTYVLTADMPAELYTIIANHNTAKMTAVGSSENIELYGDTIISRDIGDTLTIGNELDPSATTLINGDLEVTGDLILDSKLPAAQTAFILSASKEVLLPQTMSRADKQLLINSQPKHLNGYTLKFTFGDGTHNLDDALVFNAFTGGPVVIQGNATEDPTTIHKNQTAILSGRGLETANCQDVNIQNLRIWTTLGAGVNSNSENATVAGCWVTTPLGANAIHSSDDNLTVSATSIGTSNACVYKVGGTAYIYNCESVNSVTSLQAHQGAIIGYGGTTFTATTTEFIEASGGIIQHRQATQGEVNAGVNNRSYITPETLEGRKATEVLSGVIETADPTEMNTGNSGADLKAVTPEGFVSTRATESIVGTSLIAGNSVAALGTDNTTIVSPQNLAYTLSNYDFDSRKGRVKQFAEYSGDGSSSPLEIIAQQLVYLDTDGRVRAIGVGNEGCFGADNTILAGRAPGHILALPLPDRDKEVVKVYAAKFTTFVLTSDGCVYAAGYNATGILSPEDHSVAAKVPQLTKCSVSSVTKVCAPVVTTTSKTHASAFFLTSSNDLYAAGGNPRGALGLGTTVNTGTNGAQLTLAGVQDVIHARNAGTSGSPVTIALKIDGTVWTCGSGSNGALGNGGTANSSTWVNTGLTGITSIKAASDSMNASVYARASGGRLYGWGFGTSGQLGQGEDTNRETPVIISENIVDYWPVPKGLYVRTNAGVLQACGANGNNGKLGMGTSTSEYETLQDCNCPVTYGDIVSVHRIYESTFARTSNVDVPFLAAGDNANGRLGIESVADQLSFVPVTSLIGVRIPDTGPVLTGSHASAGNISILSTNNWVYSAGYHKADTLISSAVQDRGSFRKLLDI